MTDSSEDHSRFENIVILIAFVSGFAGGLLLYFNNALPIMVAIFLGTGIASLVYRFLGGTSGNSMQIGALKFTGTIAVLIGSAWFINQKLFEQENKNPVVAKVTFRPEPGQWTALGVKGTPIDIQIVETGQSIKAKQQSQWDNLPLSTIKGDDHSLKIVPPNSIFELGKLSYDELKKAGLFSGLDKSDLFFVTRRLRPGETEDLDPIPLKIKATRYGGEYSRFQLHNFRDSLVWSGSIYRKRFQVIEIASHTYFVGVVEVNHEFAQPDSMYAKIAIAEIIKKLE
jgi:hypothetical protein